jgi:cytochrome c peroxidase
MLRFYIAALFLAILILPNLFFTAPARQSAELEAIHQQFHDGLQLLQEAIQDYHQVITSGASVEQIRQQHLATRKAFKAIEFLLAYLDQESINRFINGAPLPKTEPKVPAILIIEPKGLQVLDELVFSEQIQENKEEIVKQVAQLQKHYQYVYNYQSGIQLQHRQVFEAIRQELLRVFTLGVTGFDTPGSANAVPEAREAMNSIFKAYEVYIPTLQKTAPDLAQETAGIFQQAIDYLEQNNDFDSFDRLLFLKVYINPLYELTYRSHRRLGIETIEEVQSVPQPLNYHSGNLFSEDFLNVGYFANLDASDPVLAKKTALGRMLFFDPILSSNLQGSCASCHQPQKGFTDGLVKSYSLTDDGTVQRNAPTLINAVYADKFFLDLRETDLDRQMKHVIVNEQEFATDYIVLIERLQQSREYRQLFEDCFPGIGISTHSISRALAAYVSSLRSFNSPFDRYVRGETEEIESAVVRGFNLFMGKAACGTCHFAPAFNGTVPPLYQESESEVLGVPASPDTLQAVIDTDFGRIANQIPIDGAPFYQYSFKTTTVRNVALTAPYMHNGVFETLEEVIDFYNRGGGAGLGLELEYQTLPDTPLNLNDREKQDLIAFMESLTDTTNMTVVPARLPQFEGQPEWNARKVGGY